VLVVVVVRLCKRDIDRGGAAKNAAAISIFINLLSMIKYKYCKKHFERLYYFLSLAAMCWSI
jgi:hypothetical protein